MALLYDGEFIVMRIRMAMQEDSGHYTILAENTAGQQSCSATLTVDSSFRTHHGKRYFFLYFTVLFMHSFFQKQCRNGRDNT